MRGPAKRALALVGLLMLAAGPGLAQTNYGPATPPGLDAAIDPASLQKPPAISPELAAAVERAIGTYPSIRAAKTQIRAAQADVRGAKWLSYPSVSVEGLAYAGGRRSITGDNGVTANLVVEQPLWAGGRIAGTIKRAEADKLAADAALLETVLDIELRLSDAYFALARTAVDATILGQGLDEHRRLIDTITRRVEQEISPRADLDLARSRVAQLEQQVSTVGAQRLAALQQLRELVGDPNYDPGNVPVYDPQIHHPDPAQAMEQAVTCSPTRQRLTAEALGARANVAVVTGQALPQLNAQYSHNEVTGDRVGVVLRAQTSGGLSNLSAIDAAKLRRQSADLQVGVAERDLRQQLAADIAENVSARQRIVDAAEAARASRVVTESYKRQFTANGRSWFDVMNAVREATDAEMTEADTEISAMSTAARILLRTCRWQPDPGSASAQ
jgi:adhesin transport system outer membrane protein